MPCPHQALTGTTLNNRLGVLYAGGFEQRSPFFWGGAAVCVCVCIYLFDKFALDKLSLERVQLPQRRSAVAARCSITLFKFVFGLRKRGFDGCGVL